MADFCKQCCEELFGEDCGDLSDLIDPVLVDLGMGAVALCESCGCITVDDQGKSQSGWEPHDYSY
jgi:hypothetical protein